MEDLNKVMQKVTMQMNKLIEILNASNAKVERLTRENLELKDKLKTVKEIFNN